MKIFVALLKPRLYSIRNRLRHALLSPTSFLKEVVIVGAVLLFGVSVFQAVSSAPALLELGGLSSSFLTAEAQGETNELTQLLPKVVSGIVFGFSILLFATAFISSIGHLFLSNDLDFSLTFPVSKESLFISRFFEVCCRSGFIFLLICIPAVLSIQTSLSSNLVCKLLTLLALFLFLTGIAGFAASLAIFLVRLFPASKLQEFSVVVLILACLGIFSFSNLGTELENQALGTEDLEKLAGLSSYGDWLFPVKALSEIALSSQLTSSFTLELTSLAIFALASVFVASKLFARCFDCAWENAKGNRKITSEPSLRLSSLRRFIPLDQQLMAFLTKEMRLLARDPAQLIQLLVIFVVSVFYISNFVNLKNVATLDENAALWWPSVLGISNILMTACVISALATRFIYPSLSLEGRSWLLVRMAPLKLEDLLIKKLQTWLIPSLVLAAFLGLTGSLAIGLSARVVVFSTIAVFISSAGIVALAIGIGSSYANFDWHNQTEVGSGLGSFLFMLAGFGMITIDFFPVSIGLSIISVEHLAEDLGSHMTKIISAICLIVLLICNLVAAKIALKIGHKALEERETR